MKTLITFISIVIIGFSANAQTDDKVQIVEASCGQCNFGMTDQKGCDLAVKIDGKPYWVTGTSIDRHGDAHASDGFCAVVRKAEIKGKVVDNKFEATHFKLLPLTSKKEGHEGHNHE